jgi:DNA-binding NarL/FixJ family response regulator
MRVIVADDSVLVQRGVVQVLTEAGHDVIATVADASALLAAIADDEPDVCIIDIRMPPTHSDEGLVAARRIRTQHPNIGVLVLSQYVDGDYVEELLQAGTGRVGYLLKDSLLDATELTSAVQRIVNGDVVIDGQLVRQLLMRHRVDPLRSLSAREAEVMQLMAEGRTDRGIADALFVSVKTVQTHVQSIFAKLSIPHDPSSNRRVQAVLTWLRH